MLIKRKIFLKIAGLIVVVNLIGCDLGSRNPGIISGTDSYNADNITDSDSTTETQSDTNTDAGLNTVDIDAGR